VSPLVAETVGAIAAAGLLLALAARAGVALRLPRAVAVTVLVFLAVLDGINLRERWHELDVLRAQNAGTTRDAARASCTDGIVDSGFLAFVRRGLPDRAQFYMRMPHELEKRGGAACVRFVLLPRTQVARPEQARYVVLWETATPRALADLRRRGGIVETFNPRDRLVRLP
jgi:hypothetical protein